jgi:hypothetical protein
MRTSRSLAPALAALALLLPEARAADVDPYAPADSEWVLQVNVKQLAAAPAVKKHATEPLTAALRGKFDALKALPALGIDPLKDVHTLTTAGSGLPDDRQALTIVRGGFDADKLRKSADGLVKQQPDAWKALKQGEVTAYAHIDKSGTVFAYLAVLPDGTLVLSPARKYVAAALALDPKKAPRVSEGLRKLVAAADARDDLWLASVTPDHVRKLLAKSPYASGIADDVTAFTARITVGDDLKIAFSTHTKGKKSAEEAAQLLEAAKGFASIAVQNVEGVGPLLAELINACKTSTDGGTATLSGRLSDEQIAEALKKK